MYRKGIAYRRKERIHSIARKRRIAVTSFCFTQEYLANPRRTGQWNKGKIHCSCPLCSAKSGKSYGKTNNSLRNYRISDQRKFLRLQDYLAEDIA